MLTERRDVHVQVMTAFWREQVTRCQKNHFRKSRTACKLSSLEPGVPNFFLKTTPGVCSLSQLHICQMSVDVRGRENNSGPLTRSFHPHHRSSAHIYSSLKLSSGVLVRSLMTSSVSQATLTITISTRWQIPTQDNFSTSDTTTTDASPRTDKQKNKNQEAECWYPSVLWQYPWRRTVKQLYNFTFWTQCSLSPHQSSVCFKMSSYLSVAVREPLWIWCVHTFLPVYAHAFMCTPRRAAKFIKFALLSPIRKWALPPAER